MKAYLLVTGMLFALIFAAHVWEVVDRRRVCAGLSVWAWRLVVSSARKDIP